jgi:hypothetical protein
MFKSVLGRELRKWDVMKVWWAPCRDTIVRLEPYRGAYENDPEWKGVRTAYFVQLRVGMTIFPNEDFEVMATGAKK